ncbi:hypothetical protein evm_001414 [Chilo suppressalis]|nr:hypothetical protein evm_001414 [Chilo suppressalis]
MLGVCKSLFLINICLVYVTCIIPSLSVQKLDRKVIQKKRQDTLDMCRIFNAENDKLQLLQPRSEDRTHYRSRRTKRDVGLMKLGNPVLDDESAKRIENIVDKLYEDLDERVTYRQRIIAPSTMPAFEVNKTMRRFNFAPAELIHQTTTPPSGSVKDDHDSPAVPWHKKWKHGIVPYFIDPKTYGEKPTHNNNFELFSTSSCTAHQLKSVFTCVNYAILK